MTQDDNGRVFDPEKDIPRLQARIAQVMEEEFGVTEMYVGPGSPESDIPPIAKGENAVDYMLNQVIAGDANPSRPDNTDDEELHTYLAQAAFLMGGKLLIALPTEEMAEEHADKLPGCGCLEASIMVESETGMRILTISPRQHTPHGDERG